MDLGRIEVYTVRVIGGYSPLWLLFCGSLCEVGMGRYYGEHVASSLRGLLDSPGSGHSPDAAVERRPCQEFWSAELGSGA